LKFTAEREWMQKKEKHRLLAEEEVYKITGKVRPRNEKFDLSRTLAKGTSRKKKSQINMVRANNISVVTRKPF